MSASKFNMSDVFISYSRLDKTFVQRLFNSIKSVGKEVWADFEDIPLTADWWAEIQAGIEAANAFIFIISPDSVQSDVCRQEIDHAVAMRKRLIPILHRDITEDADKAKMHSAISSHNWLFFRQEDNYDQALKTLLQAIDTDLEHGREHTRLLVKAREWRDKNNNPNLLLRGDELEAAREWLSVALDKEPEPTSLHIEYIGASVRAERDRQRRWVATLTIALAVAVLMAVFSLFQWQAANAARQDAERARQHAQRESEIARSLARSAASAQALNQANPDLALVLALSAFDVPQPPDSAVRPLVDAAYTPGTRQRLNGHTSWVWNVTYDEFGERIISASADGTIREWDAVSGEPLRILEGHQGEVSEAHYSPDGAYILSAGDDGFILWDADSGEILYRIPTEGQAWTADFTPDGAQFIGGLDNGRLFLFDTASGELVWEFQRDGGPAHGGAIWSARISPTGELAASGGEDNAVALWDMASGELVIYDNEYNGWILTVEFSSYGDYLLYGSGDSSAYLAALDDPFSVVQIFRGHSSAVNAAIFSDDNKIITGSWDNSLREWDILTGSQLRRFNGHNGGVTAVSVNYYTNQMVSSSYDNDLRIWDLANPLEIFRYRGHEDSINGIAYSPDGRTLVTASSDDTLIVWDVETGLALRILSGHLDRVDSVAFLPDNRHVISASTDKTLILWDVTNGRRVRTYAGHNDRVTKVAIAPDGKTMASASLDKTVIVWDVETGEQKLVFEQHQDRVDALAFSADGAQILSGGRDRLIYLWDAQSGDIRQTLAGHTDAVLAVLFTPDGRQAISGSWDSTIRIWDLATGQQTHVLTGHTNGVHALALNPDATRLLSGSEDFSVRLWDLEEYTELFRFDGHSAGLRAVVFSPDGRTFVSGARDWQMIEWRLPLPTDELLVWVRDNRYIRELTCNERETYRIEPLCQT